MDRIDRIGRMVGIREGRRMAEAICEELAGYAPGIIDYTGETPRISDAADDAERLRIYRLQPPADTERFRTGFCWDIGLLAISRLENAGLRAYAIYADQGNGWPNHVTAAYQEPSGESMLLDTIGEPGLRGPFASDAEACRYLAGKLRQYGGWKWTFYRLDRYPAPMSTAEQFISQARRGDRIGEW